ncbi:MAG: prenyltransferase [Candidatus Omnitrophica bacterium]|nr:prenyltransferase [Candidatus Omnitrophota bacterium]
MARLKHWFLLSRVPFLSVVILPYILGALLAAVLTGFLSFKIFLLGLFASVLVQLAAHYNGEIYDIKEDRLGATMEKNFFTGGSLMLVEKLIPEKKVKLLSYTVILLALLIGVILQFYFKTGFWTIPLGISGMICGFFYSKPPLRWVSRGTGEIFIAYAFGWLPVAAGFYLQASRFDPLATLIALPVAFSVTNIILINEFPDHPADRSAGKQNILVRIGKEKGAVLYAVLTLAAGAAFFYAVFSGVSHFSLLFYAPVLFLALRSALLMLKGAYNDRKKLEKLCGMTILVNLGTSLSFILGLLFGR